MNKVKLLLVLGLTILAVYLYTTYKADVVYLGAWTDGFWDSEAKALHPEVLHAFEQKIRKKVAIAHIYRGWHELDSDNFISELQNIDVQGWVPLVSSNPYYFDRCKHTKFSLYGSIAHGDCDEFLQSLSKRLSQYGKPLFFRFAWEMNILSNEWGIQYSASKPQEFVKAWRHIHDIMKEEGANNVIWVFSPQVNTPDSVPYKDLYPGDAYTDWVALDGYNWGTTQSWSRWQSFSEVFGSSYDELISISAHKPVMIAEFGSTDKGGDKPGWFKDAFSTLPERFPRVKALIFYDEDRSQEENTNWKITAPPETANVINQSVKSMRYSSRMPQTNQ